MAAGRNIEQQLKSNSSQNFSFWIERGRLELIWLFSLLVPVTYDNGTGGEGKIGLYTRNYIKYKPVHNKL